MNKNKLHLAILTTVLAGATLFFSCKKKETTTTPTTVDTDQSGAMANNTAEEISSDIISIGSEACDKPSSGALNNYRTVSDESTSNLSCAVVTVDTMNKIVTVAFSGNVCLDGKTRTGTLFYNYSASAANARHYRDPGFSISVTSSNYAVNGNTVNIVSKTITNTTAVGFNPANTNETWNINANLNISLSNGGAISWSCNRVKTLLNTATAYNGPATPISWASAKIGLTGSASGTRSNGETFTVNVTTQLVRDFGGCTIAYRHPFISGVFVYTPGAKSARTFNYGNGTCDLDATVTINNITYNIILP